MNTYSHVAPQLQNDAAWRMNDLLSGADDTSEHRSESGS
jgi:hypothetical protein